MAVEPAKDNSDDGPGASSRPRRRPARFAIVGLGGSAGSLPAFSQLLEHLPPTTGMAFVIVSHLDPEHPSLLTHLLSGKSSMDVTVAVDGARVQANHIYVQPPEADVILSDGHLRLRARSAAKAPHLPIDAFFRSLAAEQKQRAVAVILSGAASDGTMGLTAVKSAGGVTVAQDPASAEHPSMPSSAIATGVVDFVLPPDRIAAKLASLADHVYLSGSRKAGLTASAQSSENTAFDEIFALLRGALGVDFSAYKISTIRRRVSRRMLLHRCDDTSAYVRYLRENPSELVALQHDILIMVTEFFRDRETFEVLRARTLPDLLRGKEADAPVRLWVPGCASGEEPYSLAMTVLDTMEELDLAHPLKVFATDINERELERARRGLYPETIASAVGEDALRRHFVRSEAGYQVSKGLRDVCVFARHDLTRDPPFPRIDLLSCRNVLIYMTAALQRRVMPLLHYALLPGGCLVLGHAESLGSLGELFTPIDRKHKVFVKKTGSSPPLAHPGFTPAQAEGPAEPLDAVRRTLEEEAEHALLLDFVPPGVTLDANLEVVRYRGDTARFLRNPPGRPTQKVFDLISPDLSVDLRTALDEAGITGAKAVRRGVPVADDASVHDIDLHVVPFESQEETHYVLLFEEVARRAIGEAGRKTRAGTKASESERLQRELRATRERLEAVVQEQEAANEELRAANEEILSSSEEMQSVNEELETASEELHSTNEELESRNAELWQLADDLNNLLSSASLPIVMVDRDLRMRRFTPEAGRLFGVAAGDLGQPVTELARRIGIEDLDLLLSRVLDGIATVERSVRDANGRRYAARVRPYLTADHHIDGAVLTLTDVDELTQHYEVQRRIATTLQESFIHPLPRIEGLAVGHFSAPANSPELVGGDFCDLFRLHNGRICALIGDVIGKGVRAARLAETTRSAVRAVALSSMSPAFILGQANLVLHDDDDTSQLVTACLVVLDLKTGHGVVATAGHPPPAHVGLSRCVLFELPQGTPLGAFARPFEETTFSLEDGEALVLYTDGVTEARRNGKLFDESGLLAALREARSAEPRHLVDRLTRALLGFAGVLTDDVQILALQRTSSA